MRPSRSTCFRAAFRARRMASVFSRVLALGRLFVRFSRPAPGVRRASLHSASVLKFGVGVAVLRSLREPPKQSRLGGFKVDDQLIFGRLPDRPLGVRMLRLSTPSKAAEWTCSIRE